jgi:SAM-dependent methyltransferase
MIHLNKQFFQTTLNWELLPFWKGISDHSRSINHCPLTLSVSTEGLLVQSDKDGFIANVVAKYADTAYGFITPPPGTSVWGTSLAEAKLHNLNSFIGNLDGLRILEIGGANLFLASKLFSEYKLKRYVVIDPALKPWPEQPGVEVHRTYFPCSDLGGEHFDLVLAHNVLEHVPNPENFLVELRKKLAPNGYAYLTFPEVTRQFAKGDLNAILHEHLTYFDETSARILFAKSGLEVVKWKCANDLATCLLAAGPPNKTNISEAVKSATKLLSLAKDGYLSVLPKAVSALKYEIETGRKVAFYGATNGLNNLLYLYGVGHNVPILDGDRSKVGRFIPEAVKAIQWIGNAEPCQFEMIFITAGSFQDEIINELTNTYDVPRDRINCIF